MGRKFVGKDDALSVRMRNMPWLCPEHPNAEHESDGVEHVPPAAVFVKARCEVCKRPLRPLKAIDVGAL